MKKILAILVLIAVTAAYAQQGAKSATTLDAASCFRIDGISSLKVERGPEDYMILRSNMTFVNFTDKILGTDKKQDIRLKDLDVTVYLTDTTKEPTRTEKIVNGKLVVSVEYPQEQIGMLKVEDDFIIPKNGITSVFSIAMDQLTKDGNKTEIINPSFDKFVRFFNLMNAVPSKRETSRIVFKGVCKVAVRGENGTWLWASEPINFEWPLKPNSKNEYILETID